MPEIDLGRVNGFTFTPSVNDSGVLSWSNDGGLPNPPSVNVKGPQGPKGDAGEQGPKGDKGDKGDDGQIPAADLQRISDNESDIADLKSENALLRELLNGVDAPIYRKASGNPATFSDGYDNATLKSLVVTIPPTQSGSGDPSPDNVRPIVGYSSVTVQRTAENLFDADACETTSYYYDSDGVRKYGTTVGSTVNYTAVAPETAYTLSGQIGASGLTSGVYFYDAGKNWISRITRTVKAPYAFTTPPNCAFIRFQFVKSVFDAATVQLVETQSVTSVTVPLVDSNGDPLTVYGGNIDIISGTLTVTHGQIASYDGETLPDDWISDRDAYAVGTVPTTGAQVVYPLDTPLSYQLTPVSLTSLSGYNCVFADAGTLSVAYRADTQLSSP